MENSVIKSALVRIFALAAVVGIGMTTSVAAQGEAAPSSQTSKMLPMMMGQGMMQSGMAGAMPPMAMHGHLMKIMFAIADLDGDGGLSFVEVTAIHRRIFDMIDANKDGNMTPEELQEFMRE